MQDIESISKAAIGGALQTPLVTFTPDVSAEDAPEVTAIPLKNDRTDYLVDFQESLKEVEAATAAKGAVIGIEYIDSRYNVTMRRIRINRVYERDGCLYLSAFCFERNAVRTFCIGGIKSIYDVNGEIFDDVPRYLHDILGITIPDGSIAAEAPHLLDDILPLCGDGLPLLVAIARCDGELHRKEVTAIIKWCDSIAGQHDLHIDDHQREALRAHIARLYPSETMIQAALAAGISPDLMATAEKIIQADGKIAPEEQALRGSLKSRRQAVALPWQPAKAPQPPADWPWIVPYAYRFALGYDYVGGQWTIGTPPRYSFKVGDLLHHRSGLYSIQVKSATSDTSTTDGQLTFRAFARHGGRITQMYDAQCSQAEFAIGLQHGGLLAEEPS